MSPTTLSTAPGRAGGSAPVASIGQQVPVFVVGASGLLTGELLRLLELHPELSCAGAASRVAGKSLSEHHPHLAPTATGSLATSDLAGLAVELERALADGDSPVALVLGLPHGQSAAAWRELRGKLGPLAERLHVVDLSADYRLADPEVYARWYGAEHADPPELGRFVYGLAEWKRAELAGATRIASPGCFATALQLACLPAAQAGLLDGTRPFVLNAITGSSGSGNAPKATTHHPHRNGNLWAYGLGGHRHEAELLASLSDFDLAPELTFLPHSGPFVRGIHLTAVLPLAGSLDGESAARCYADAYAQAPFVEVLTEGVPDLRSVVGSNRVSLATHVRGQSLVVLLTLDNVIKGGSGQALQCLNLALGLPETRGLPLAGLGVV